MNDTKNINVTVGEQSFTFSKTLTIGEELKLYGRRSALCGGEYGAMSTSKELTEQMGAIMAHRIATLELHLMNANDKFLGFDKLDGDSLSEIWKEFATKAGLFRKDDGKGDDGKKADDSKGIKKDGKDEPT